MRDILLARLAAVAIAAAVVAGCAVIEDQAPVFSVVMSRAAELGGCVKVVCALPLSDCRLRPGRCQQ